MKTLIGDVERKGDGQFGWHVLSLICLNPTGGTSAVISSPVPKKQIEGRAKRELSESIAIHQPAHRGPHNHRGSSKASEEKN